MTSKEILIEAIALRRCVRSTYNGDQVQLAPHILYMHHDEFFVDAVTVARNGAPAKKIKLGVFKLSGLKGLALDGLVFQPMRKFHVNADTFKGTIVSAVS